MQNPKEANVSLGGGKVEAMFEQSYREFVSLPSAKKSYLIHLSFWHQDERTVDGITPEGWGASFSATWRLKDKWRPFLRLGWSDGGGGAPVKAAVTVGTGIDMRNHDEFSIAANWSEPSTEGFRNSVTLETYYRFQLSQPIAIWPNLQVVFRPAFNPNVDTLAVFSLTGRIVF